MLDSPISASLTICEKILVESDNVISAIRLVDIFFFNPIDGVPLEKTPVRIAVLAQCKFRIGSAEGHALKLRLLRPSGELKDASEELEVKLVPSLHVPNAPLGLNAGVTLDVIPKEEGTHWLILLIDGEEVSRTPFTLLQRRIESTRPTEH